MKSKFLSNNGNSFSGLGGDHELGVTTTIGAPGYGNTHDRPAAPQSGMIWDGFQWHPAPNKKHANQYRQSKYPPSLINNKNTKANIDTETNIIQGALINSKLNTKYPPNPMNALPLLNKHIAIAAAISAKKQHGKLLPQTQTILKLANVNNNALTNNNNNSNNNPVPIQTSTINTTPITTTTTTINANNNNNGSNAIAHLQASEAIKNQFAKFYNEMK